MDAPHGPPKTHGEKSRWQQHKIISCCLEQILEATPHKTATARSLKSYLKKNPRKMSKSCGTLLEKQGRTSEILLWTPTYGCLSVSPTAKYLLRQLSADTGCRLEILPGEMDDRDGLRERERER